MSHTIDPVSGSNLRFVQPTIVDYVTGGESFTAAEFQVEQILGVLLGEVPANQNSLGVPLFPLLNAGKVQLFRFVGGAPVQIPSTVGLNAVVPAILCIV